MTVGVDAWLVADSEEEDAFAQLPPDNGSGASAATRPAAAGNLTSPDSKFRRTHAHPSRNKYLLASAIQTAVFTPDQPCTPPRGHQSPSTLADEPLFTPPLGGIDSTIGNFASVPSKSGAPSEMVPKPRPRPRVVMKKAVTCDHDADVANTSFSHISDPPFSATRRTFDSIYPATATSFGFSEVVDDAYSSFGIAERAKMRSRKSQTAKKPINPPAQMNEVIELTSDEDELTLKPTKRQRKQGDPVPKPKVQTKPRPKPKLKVKPAAVFPSGSPPSPTVIRDPPAPRAQCASSSQLPPSTLPTIPPSTPPQARELSPLSSPPVTTRKRKRIRPSIAEDDDEMDIIGGNPTAVSPSFTMPPPFFAPSSSSVPTDSGIEISPVELLSGQGKKKQVPSGKNGAQKKTQNKGKKGKKGEMTSAVDKEPARLTQEPSTPATRHNPSLARERHSPAARNSTTTKTATRKQTVTKKGKTRAMDSCEEEDEPILPSKSNITHTPPADEGEGQRSRVHGLSSLRRFTHALQPRKFCGRMI
jgi:hypothetical protein